MQNFDLTGKVIIITGAATGIGEQCAYDLADMGATVIATDIDEAGVDATAAKIIKGNGKAISIRHDVTSEADWDKLIETCKQQFSRLDVLVNNAGIMMNIPFALCSYEDFKKQQTINVDSVFIGCKAAYELMAESGMTTSGSSIINLSSIFGQISGPMHTAYCASKGAIRMLSKSMAVELGRMGTKIRVNSVHPGPINTELGRSAAKDAEKLGLLADADERNKQVGALFPMGRWGEVEDVSGVIAFLASDASQFVTGAELVVDGAYSIV
jgi:NAD(P)-dependent dehydrogenase (short-subunit alcohol dehydrogenase family)